MKKYIVFLLLVFSFLNINCNIFKTLTNVSRLKFKLGNVSNFQLSGITISNKNKITDFGTTDALRLSQNVLKGQLPVTFTLNIEAKNPNDGTGGYGRTSVQLVSFPWRMYIDNKETITGNISAPITVPGTGESSVFPLTIQMDLMKFFKDNQFESIINLALALGGSKGSPSRITLYAKPTISTSLGNITYPGEIKIVDKKFNEE